MKKALIFGAGGQDGQFLAPLLAGHGYEVLGVSRAAGEHQGDVSDLGFVDAMIAQHRPELVFHFAANSSTRHETLFENHSAISTGTLAILESVRRHSPTSKVFLSGSAMQFRNDGRPIREDTPFEASSPYSVARIQSVYAGRYFRAAFGMRVYVGYFFNHDSPLRSERHVNQKIVAAVRRMGAGSRERLVLGNVDVRKEFNYAGDVVEAVWTLVNQSSVFESVIGCGRAYSISEWLETCFAKFGMNWRDWVDVDPRFVPEYQVLVSDPALIQSIGWRPRVDLRGLAVLMLGAP